jgi:DNA mismatch repair protein PMS2
MAMKHATSKIRRFDDIYNCGSLGFRGEALFCLANISGSLVVATRTADQLLGEKLTFTREGYLQHETVCPVPRKVGTTVAVVKLFDALPVRRADMEKRIQAQRQKVFLMVQGCKYGIAHEFLLNVAL